MHPSWLLADPGLSVSGLVCVGGGGRHIIEEGLQGSAGCLS